MNARDLLHLAVLAGAATLLALAMPAARTLIAVDFGAALAALALARLGGARGRRWALPEALLLAGLGAVAWRLTPAWPPAVLMAAACLLLVPPRPGALRTLVALVAATLVIAGVAGAPPRTPVLAGAVLLACTALAADAWQEAVRGARAPRRARGWPSWLRWCAWPALAAAAAGLALAAATGLDRRDPASLPALVPGLPAPPAATRGAGLDSTLHIGALRDIVPDATPAARLEPAPPGPGMVYLRAQALGRLRRLGPALLWSVDAGTLVPVPPAPAHGAQARVLRLAGGGDTVLRPEAWPAALLDRLQADAEGNLYRAGLGAAACTYLVAADAADAPDTGDPARWRRLPADLAADLAGLGDPRWATAPPEEAAPAVAAWLAARCTYGLDRLPAPADGPAGALRTFLADPDPARRRGHCQYFATAATVLLRLAGHPARVVVGYASDERDAGGVTFRVRDAHAWCEVLDGGRRWRRVEATPAGSFDLRAAASAPALARAAAAPPAPALAPVALPAPAADRPAAPTADGWRRMGGIALVVLAALLLAAALRRRRAPARGGRTGRQAEDLLALARDLGVPVAAATTLSQVAAALGARTGIDLDHVLAAHLAARFGGGPPPPPWPLAALRAAAAQRSRTSVPASAPS